MFDKDMPKENLLTSSLENKEFEITLQDVEAILNSGPLNILSCGAKEQSLLCPAHFLVRKSLITLQPEKIRVTLSTKGGLKLTNILID